MCTNNGWRENINPKRTLESENGVMLGGKQWEEKARNKMVKHSKKKIKHNISLDSRSMV